MIYEKLQGVIRKADYTLTDSDIESWVERCIDAENDDTIDFSLYRKNVFTQGSKKRMVYCFPTDSVENFVCHYLKTEMDRVFRVKYASRSKIINLLFNTVPALKNINDFVIIRADFKSFFDSVLSSFVYENYILPSLLLRSDKDLMEKYVREFKYCYAGLCLSNGMTELVCRDFDKRLQAKMTAYGVFFYERYVDDMLMMTSKYISRDNVINVINETISEVFKDCPVKLNMSAGKFSYISRRNMGIVETFNFLGYEFFINMDVQGNISFEYGITAKKRKRYSNIIERAFIDYSISKNEELLRQRVKIFSSRVVIARQLVGQSFDWLTKGINANYNELQQYTELLHNDTKDFMKNLYYELLRKNHIKRPYFIEKDCDADSMYNILSNLRRNRTILFEEKIGIPAERITEWILKINPRYSSLGKEYYRIVMDYLELIKIE